MRKSTLNVVKDKINNFVDIFLNREDLYDNGAIYYMNGNDGTKFDYEVNDRTCEFMVFYKSEWGAIKSFVDTNDDLIVYVYDKEDFTKVNYTEKVYLGKERTAKGFCEYLEKNFDNKGIYDQAI